MGGNILNLRQRFLTCFLSILTFSVYAIEGAEITCQFEDCSTIAPYKNIQFKEQNGIDVFVSPLFNFTISNNLIKLTKLHKSIVLEGDKKDIFIVSDVELDDFGLNKDDSITLRDFFRYSYLEKYSKLNLKNSSVNALLAIKAYKLSIGLSSKTNVFHFKVKNISFYTYYDPESTTYEIHGISDSDIMFGQHLSLVGVTQEDFINLVSSIRVK